MFDIILKGIFILTLTITDVEDDGTHNYLFETRLPGSYQLTHISYSSKEAINVKEGGKIEAEVFGMCSKAFGVDEEMSDRTNSWISYQALICNADKLEVIK